MTRAFQHHIFLSYSHRDLEIMRRVRSTLQAEGLTVWTDEGIEPGTPIWDRAIENALKSSGCMVVILTPNVIDSKGVRDEINYANIHKVRVFPLLAAGTPSESVIYPLSSTQWVDIRTSSDDGLERIADTIRAYLNLNPIVSSKSQFTNSSPSSATEYSPVIPQSLPSTPTLSQRANAPEAGQLNNVSSSKKTSNYTHSPKALGKSIFDIGFFLVAGGGLGILCGALRSNSDNCFYTLDPRNNSCGNALLISGLLCVVGLVFGYFLKRVKSSWENRRNQPRWLYLSVIGPLWIGLVTNARPPVTPADNIAWSLIMGVVISLLLLYPSWFRR